MLTVLYTKYNSAHFVNAVSGARCKMPAFHKVADIIWPPAGRRTGAATPAHQSGLGILHTISYSL
jgi:hypothetical protein